MSIYDEKDLNSADWFVVIIRPVIVGVVFLGLYIVASRIFSFGPDIDQIARLVVVFSPALALLHYVVSDDFNEAVRSYAKAKLALIPLLFIVGCIAVKFFGVPNPIGRAMATIEEVTAQEEEEEPPIPTLEEQEEAIARVRREMPPTREADNLGYHNFVTNEGENVKGHVLTIGKEKTELLLEDGTTRMFDLDDFYGRHREYLDQLHDRYEEMTRRERAARAAAEAAAQN